MSAAAYGKLGFDIGTIRHGDGWRTEARFECGCGEVHRQLLPNTSSKGLNPEAVAKRACADRWKADGFRRSVTKCPKCQSSNSAGESPGEKKVIKMPVAAQAPTTTTQLRDATPQERVRIRNLLDKHFDDGAGCYLDGYSDQKVGEEAGVPWAIVTKIREAAYGPIRVDPEVTSLRAAAKKLAEAQAHITKDIADITARIEALSRKRSAA